MGPKVADAWNRLRRVVRPPQVPFPKVNFVALTWGIPEEFGGMTNVLLRRSSKIAELGAIRVPILTLDPKLDVVRAEAQLRERGLLDERVDIRNCWSEIAQMDDHRLTQLAETADPPPEVNSAADGEVTISEDGRRKTIQWPGDGTFIVEHLRMNGTIFVRDERRSPGKRVTLCDHKGEPMAAWPTMRGLYFAWIDSVVDSAPTVLVNDSEFVGNFLQHYQRPHVRTIQVIHTSHLQPGVDQLRGPFLRSCRKIVTEHAQYDALALLTQTQEAEFHSAFPTSQTIVIPNSRSIPKRLDAASTQRDPRRGIVLARLTDQKRVDHAVRAHAALNADSERAAARLDIYGSGEDHAVLTELIKDLGVADSVTLHGYRSDAAQQLESASYLVLSSRFEGAPLVLVEAMAAGCVPIAYDIRYGPADIITHGIDGFLVPPGDIKALASTIRDFLELNETKQAQMRSAAQRSAQRFNDTAVIQMWADAFRELITSPRPSVSVGKRAAVNHAEASSSSSELVLRGSLSNDWPTTPDELFVKARSRSGLYGFEVPVKLEPSERFAARIPLDYFQTDAVETFDFWLTRAGAQKHRRISVGRNDEVDFLNADGIGGKLYETVKGNLSFTTGASQPNEIPDGQ